jgi:hypothetical protein
MLLQTIYLLALGGARVAAKFGRNNKLPWSWLYSGELLIVGRVAVSWLIEF